MSIGDLILKNVKCTICGAGYGQCDCWRKCQCGWSHAKDDSCNNPGCKSFNGTKKPLQVIASGNFKD